MKPSADHKEIRFFDLKKSGQLPTDFWKNHFTHILCLNGTVQFRMDHKKWELGKNDMVIGLPASEIGELKLSRDFKGNCFLVGFDIMSRNNPDIGWGIRAYLYSKEHPVVSLAEGDAAHCLQQFSLLAETYEDQDHLFRKERVDLQLQLFILDMWNLFSKEIQKRSNSGHKGSLFERFLQLVQEHCMEEREVDYYAEKLYISSKYLTEVSKKNSGKTASEWIHNYTTQRLILLLQNPRLSFTEIADTLNFSSQSFFSRYVKKVLGMSPTEYRNRMTGI